MHLKRVAVGVPFSIRLDDDIRDELEAQAHARGVGLATLLRELATKAALVHGEQEARVADQAVELGGDQDGAAGAAGREGGGEMRAI